MRRTIGVLGLTSNENVGDYLLVDAAMHLLRTHDPDTVLVGIDVDPWRNSTYRGRRWANLRVFQLMNKFGRLVRHSPRLAYAYTYLSWRIKLGWYFDERLRDLDAIVIAGGGFIKFKTQGLNYLDELILKTARKRGIPVMMNAVGVEGYSETDIRCQRLKRVLNFENVRVITTRDDIDTLNNRYITSPSIVTDQVGDPVFWLAEMELVDRGRERAPGRAGNRIGINLINPGNFSGYGGKISQAAVINFYKNLIAELTRRGADFTLFSNGMEVDQQFGELLVETMNLSRHQLVRRPATSTEFVDLVAGFDIIMSARMHAGITAYAIDVPVVGLIWGEKLQFLTELTGLRDRYFDENELDPVRMAALLVENNLPEPNLERRAELRERTRRRLAEFVDSLPGGAK